MSLERSSPPDFFVDPNPIFELEVFLVRSLEAAGVVAAFLDGSPSPLPALFAADPVYQRLLDDARRNPRLRNFGLAPLHEND